MKLGVPDFAWWFILTFCNKNFKTKMATKKQNGRQNTTLVVTRSNLNNIVLSSYRPIVITSQLKKKQIKQNEYPSNNFFQIFACYEQILFLLVIQMENSMVEHVQDGIDDDVVDNVLLWKIINGGNGNDEDNDAVDDISD